MTRIFSYKVLPVTQSRITVVSPDSGRHIVITYGPDGRWQADAHAVKHTRDARATQRLTQGLRSRDAAVRAAVKVLLGDLPRVQVYV